MKKTVFFVLFLTLALAHSAHAYGTYSQDQLNTTNTEQNVSLGMTTFWSYEDDTEDSASSSGGFIGGYEYDYAVDEDLSTYSNCVMPCNVYENTIVPSGVYSANWTFKLRTEGYGNSIVSYWNYTSSAWEVIYNADPGTIVTVEKTIPSDGLVGTLKINTTGTYYYEGKATWFGLNVTPLSETVWTNIPRRANITGAEWDLTGYRGTTFDHIEYQEDANATSCTGSWLAGDPCADTYDGNWGATSFGGANAGANAYLWQNYTVPDYALSSIWVSQSDFGIGTINSTIPDLCFEQQPFQIKVNLRGADGLPSLSQFDCWNGTGWHEIRNDYAGRYLWEDAVYWNVSGYPKNVTIDTGNDGSLDYINDTEFKTTETIDLNATAINDYLHDTCTADWATGTCDVPFNVSSDFAGTLMISVINLSGEYLAPIDNCSGEYQQSSINFTFADEHTLAAMNGSAEYVVVVLDACCNYTYNDSVVNVSEFGFCILGDSLNVNMMMLYRYAGYEQRTYYFYQAELTDTLQSISLYQITSSLGEKVEANTRDSNDNDLADVYVNIDRYYPETDSYRTMAIGLSDDSGTFITYLDLDDVFYRFTLSQAGVAVNTYSAMTITDSADDPETLILYIGALETQFFEMIGDIGVSCDFNETSNNTVCSITDPSGLATSATLYVQKQGLASITTICTDSGSGASFTLTCNIPNPSGGYKYFVEATPYPNPSYTLFTDFFYVSPGANIYGIAGLFIAMLLIIAMAGIGIYVHELLGIILGVTMGLIAISGIITLPGVAITSLVIIGVLILVGSRKR